MTSLYRTPTGTMQLRPVQAAALAEAHDCGGGFFPLGVGWGKTLISFLAPTLLEAQRPLLLVPAQLRDQTLCQAFPELRKHWAVTVEPRVVSYSELSLAKNAGLLEEYNPDLIIADEAHCLKRAEAARTRRFRAFMQRAKPRFIAMSGTVTKASILDYAHLLRWALGEGAPLPSGWRELQSWAGAIDAEGDGPEGILAGWCKEGEHCRGGYRRRLTETPGVVATEETGYEGSLVLQAALPEVPFEVKRALKDLEAAWCTPGGEEIEDAVAMARHMKELSQGCYYIWEPAPPKEWLSARAEWHRFVRDALNRRFKGIDSPLQVAQAVDSGRLEGVEVLNRWRAVKPAYEPTTVPVWQSRFLLDFITDWMQQGEGLVWVEHDAIGRELPNYFGAGRNDVATALGAVALSAHAHATGKNLQAWSRNLVICPPSSGLRWEQLIGRTHRTGQKADEVIFDVCTHTKCLTDSLDHAKLEAQYIAASTGQRQKLELARMVGL
jgi:hypothetical protein